MKPVKIVSAAVVFIAFLCHTGCKSDTDSTTQSGSQTELTDSNSISSADSKLFDKVRSIISTTLHVQNDQVQLASQLEDDLGADDLDKIDLVLALEKQFDITIEDQDWDHVKTVNDVVVIVRKNVKAD